MHFVIPSNFPNAQQNTFYEQAGDYAYHVKENSPQDKFKVVLYGGNGFVGTHAAQELAKRDVCAVCLSRSGHKPIHLKDEKWSESVRWCKGDANAPDTKLLERMNALVTLVGSPPIPTLSQAAFDEQLYMNGTVNANAIKAAGEAGIKTVVLMGAQIPLPMRSDRFGYTKGKRIALEAAREFSELSDEHRAVVLQPGGIYGKRHLKSGKAIHLDWFMKPMSVLMPWQFVSVERIAKRIADELTADCDTEQESFKIIKNRQI